VTVDEFFAGHDESRRLFDRVREVVTSLGPAQVRVTKSQIAFRRPRGLASVWMPGQYPGATDVPLVLTVGLRRRDDSARSKQVVEPAPGRLTHHLELRAESQVDDEVRAWLTEARETAG
jgi:hypothetical protein